VTPVLGPPAAEPARRIARAVLAEPEYRAPGVDSDLRERIWAWILSLFDRVHEAASHLPSWLTWLVVAWLAITFLAITAHSIYTLFVIGGGRVPDGARPSRAIDGELFGIADLDFDRVLGEAAKAREARDWERAIRYGYAAFILLFDRAGWVAFAASKTNRDYLEELRDRERAERRFRASTDGFEKVIYGGGPPTESVALGILENLEALRSELAPSFAG